MNPTLAAISCALLALSTGCSSSPSTPPLQTETTCAEDHAEHWRPLLPAECQGRRVCVDDRHRFWLDGVPFVPRGVYNAGFEYTRVLSNCPVGQPCEATTPADVDAFVTVLADAGFNLVMERSRAVPLLLEALHKNTQVHIAHLVDTDPFTQESHDAVTADVEAAAADPDVLMWFGPDEIDVNGTWSTAGGIRRILHGSNPTIDANLAGILAPSTPDPWLPDVEAAHDPEGRPFGAALYSDDFLGQAELFYDLVMPVTYPLRTQSSRLDTSPEGTRRVRTYGGDAPTLPVLQLTAIPPLWQVMPTPVQAEGMVMSALVEGANGAFFFNVTGDGPRLLGREGWYAPDATDTWAAFASINSTWDGLVPALFADALEDHGETPVPWRSFSIGQRRVVIAVNPISAPIDVDIAALLGLQPTQVVRRWENCDPFDQGIARMEPYAWVALEVVQKR